MNNEIDSSKKLKEGDTVKFFELPEGASVFDSDFTIPTNPSYEFVMIDGKLTKRPKQEK